jgi:hypothetical protein
VPGISTQIAKAFTLAKPSERRTFLLCWVLGRALWQRRSSI